MKTKFTTLIMILAMATTALGQYREAVYVYDSSNMQFKIAIPDGTLLLDAQDSTLFYMLKEYPSTATLDQAIAAGDARVIKGGLSGVHWSRNGNYVFTANLTDSVGIGTTTPQAKLDVVGDVNIDGTVDIGDNTLKAKTIKSTNSDGLGAILANMIIFSSPSDPAIIGGRLMGTDNIGSQVFYLPYQTDDDTLATVSYVDSLKFEVDTLWAAGDGTNSIYQRGVNTGGISDNNYTIAGGKLGLSRFLDGTTTDYTHIVGYNEADSMTNPIWIKRGVEIDGDSIVEKDRNEIANLNWMAWGDSFTADSYRYWYNVINDLGMYRENFTNKGNPGDRLNNINDRLDADLASDPNLFDNIDIVTLQNGANDYTGNRRIGTMSDTASAGLQTMYSSLKYFIKTVLEKNPDIRLYIMTPTEADYSSMPYKAYNQFTDYSIERYSECISEVCAYYGISVIDWYNESGFNEFTISSYTSDGLHPAGIGAERLAEIVEHAFLNRKSSFSWSRHGLMVVNEDGKVSYRLYNRSEQYKGDGGTGGVDFSYSGGLNSVRGATGDYSFALGVRTIASGTRSIAGVYTSTASGDNSVALAEGTVVSGTNSASFCKNALITNKSSFASGGTGGTSVMTVSGVCGFSHQYLTTAKENAGNYSAILGGVDNSIEASATNSVILGGNSQNATLANTVYMENLKSTNIHDDGIDVSIHDIKFPTSDGTASQHLITNGSGSLSWGQDVTTTAKPVFDSATITNGMSIGGYINAHDDLYVAGTIEANGTTDVNGAVNISVSASILTANTTLSDKMVYLFNPTATGIVASLPSSTGITGRIYIITNLSSYTMTVTANGTEKISAGSSNYTIGAESVVTLIASGQSVLGWLISSERSY